MFVYDMEGEQTVRFNTSSCCMMLTNIMYAAIRLLAYFAKFTVKFVHLSTHIEYYTLQVISLHPLVMCQIPYIYQINVNCQQ